MPAMSSVLAEALRAGRPFGVTRLARLTGLDRCGVEVVGAVRPTGHVLQVSQGKGRTLAEAAWSAVGEAIELSAAEAPDPGRLHFGPASERSTFDVGGLRVAWVQGADAATGAAVEVPAEAVFCPPAGGPWLGPSVTTWRSNGLGAHPTSRRRAVEHALLEVLERDALAEVLPSGWTPAAGRRLVAAPAWERHFGARRFACFAFDLTPRRLEVSVAGALLFDLEGGAVPLTAGYACRRTWAAAADAAVLEAAQSRLTEIHGAREDVMLGAREAGAGLLRELQRRTPRPAPRRTYRGALAAQLPGSVALVELRARPFVVKAVSDALRVSELL